MPLRLYSIAVGEGERGRGEGGREITLSEKKGEVPFRLWRDREWWPGTMKVN